MPKQSGIQLQEQLHHLSPETRVIVITGREESAIRGLALHSDAFAFFSKPVNSEVFLASVRAALGRIENQTNRSSSRSPSLALPVASELVAF